MRHLCCVSGTSCNECNCFSSGCIQVVVMQHIDFYEKLNNLFDVCEKYQEKWEKMNIEHCKGGKTFHKNKIKLYVMQVCSVLLHEQE